MRMGSQGEYEIDGGESIPCIIDETPTPAPRDIASQSNGNTPAENGSEEVPAWKRAMLGKKRKEELAKQNEGEQRRQEEEERWKDVPTWKRRMMEEKEKKRAGEKAQEMEENKGQLELKAKLAEMPEWKRKMILKKVYLDNSSTDENANPENN